MKKTLLSLLTTVAFATPTFAANVPLNETAGTYVGTTPTVITEEIVHAGIEELKTHKVSTFKPFIDLINALETGTDITPVLTRHFTSKLSPVDFICMNGLMNPLFALLHSGLKLVETEPTTRFSPYMSTLAVYLSVENFETVLSSSHLNNVSLDLPDNEGYTLLSYIALSITKDPISKVKLLLEKGARTDILSGGLLPLSLVMTTTYASDIQAELKELLQKDLTPEQIKDAEDKAQVILKGRGK